MQTIIDFVNPFVIALALCLIFALWVIKRQRQIINDQCDEIEHLKESCLVKDGKLDILIKALGRHQVTINEPRRRGN